MEIVDLSRYHTLASAAVLRGCRKEYPFSRFHATLVDCEVQRLIVKQEHLREELVRLAIADPHTVTIPKRFCVGPSSLWRYKLLL